MSKVVIGRGKCGMGWEGGCMMGCSEGIGSWVVLTFFFSWHIHRGFGFHLDLFFFACQHGIYLYLTSKL